MQVGQKESMCLRGGYWPPLNVGVCVAQNLGQRIGKTSWMGEPENVSVGHGVSLLQWRNGGVEHPHDTPPYPFMPSPTFVHSSGRTHSRRFFSDGQKTH